MTPSFPNRRALLRGLPAASLALAGLGAASPAWAAPETLRQAAAASGLRYGSTTGPDIDRAPPTYQALFAEQCSLLAPNSTWQAESPTPGALNLQPLQGTLAFAATNRILVTGLHIFWYLRLPGWFDGLDRDAATKAVLSHTKDVVSALRDRVFAWNVLNEDLKPKDGRPGGVKAGGFLDRCGLDAAAEMFHVAHAADPRALLIINDYNLEDSSPGAAAQRRAMLGVLDELKRRGAPIHGVGIQSHIKTDLAFDAGPFRQFLAEIAARGVRILVTELDVQDSDAPSDPAARDREVAAAYARYLGTVLDERAAEAIVTWGLTDKYSWINSGYSKNFQRSDRLPQRPLPFGDDLQPKPAYEALLKAFRSAPKRSFPPTPA